MAERRKLTPEEARRIARLGKAASPWNQQPSCVTKKAHKIFHKNRRLHLIKAIAERKGNKP